MSATQQLFELNALFRLSLCHLRSASKKQCVNAHWPTPGQEQSKGKNEHGQLTEHRVPRGAVITPCKRTDFKHAILLNRQLPESSANENAKAQRRDSRAEPNQQARSSQQLEDRNCPTQWLAPLPKLPRDQMKLYPRDGQLIGRIRDFSWRIALCGFRQLTLLQSSHVLRGHFNGLEAEEAAAEEKCHSEHKSAQERNNGCTTHGLDAH
jgi:hypothetical protein